MVRLIRASVLTRPLEQRCQHYYPGIEHAIKMECLLKLATFTRIGLLKEYYLRIVHAFILSYVLCICFELESFFKGSIMGTNL